MDFKKSNAEPSTVTRDIRSFDGPTGNLYESISIISKRANQISSEIKEELSAKLAEFASNSDNLEEIFENREQIEISKFYEKLPKPVSMAIDQLLNDEIYVRHPEVIKK
jgi:DNA-directed RNA polymerase subunit K/omega